MGSGLQRSNRWRLVSIGAYFAYVEHPFAGQRSTDVSKRLADEENLLTIPGDMFGAGQERFVRLAFANVADDKIPPCWSGWSASALRLKARAPVARLAIPTDRATRVASTQRRRSRPMPHATTPDGVKLYYEEAGSGTPILFVHEYSGDWRSWEPQMRFFARRHRCITYSFRGYPGSDVPESGAMYGQQHAVDDAKHMLDHLKIAKAHVVGLSQGAFATAHFGRLYRRPRAVAHAGRRRLGRRPRRPRAVQEGRHGDGRSASARKAWPNMPMASPPIRRARASSRRTRAASPSS